MNVSSTNNRIIAGKVGAPHGIKGWVRVFSYTDPIENLIDYQPWWLELRGEQHRVRVVHHQMHNDVLLVGFEGVDDRDAALELTHASIYIDRACLPQAAEGEYYWLDLQGLTVTNLQGFVFGQITHLMSTGANDVMFIKGTKEYCLPYLPKQVVKEVDLASKQMIVDWPEEIE